MALFICSQQSEQRYNWKCDFKLYFWHVLHHQKNAIQRCWNCFEHEWFLNVNLLVLQTDSQNHCLTWLTGSQRMCEYFLMLSWQKWFTALDMSNTHTAMLSWLTAWIFALFDLQGQWSLASGLKYRFSMDSRSQILCSKVIPFSQCRLAGWAWQEAEICLSPQTSEGSPASWCLSTAGGTRSKLYKHMHRNLKRHLKKQCLFRLL